MFKISSMVPAYYSNQFGQGRPKDQYEFIFEKKNEKKKEKKKPRETLKNLNIKELQELLAEMETNLGIPQTNKAKVDSTEIEHILDIKV